VGHFLRCGLKVRPAELRRFQRFFQ